MKKVISIFLMLGFVSLLSSCAFMPEKIKLNPNVGKIPTSNIGHGKKVAVRVVDERPSDSLGGRASGYGPAANISLASSLTASVRRTVYAGLRAHGFKPVPYQANISRKLTLRIIALQYKQHVGLLTAGIDIDSTIEATAMRGVQSYDHLYRGKEDNRVLFTPTSKRDNENVNMALSITLREIVTDQKLMQFLAK